MPTERTAEIWSTRLQRELVALTTGESADEKDTVGVLPPFVTVQDHTIDIDKGLCDVTFRVHVEVAAAAQSDEKEEEGAGGDKGKEEEEGAKDEAAEGAAGAAADGAAEGTAAKTESTREATTTEDKDKEKEEEPDKATETFVTVMLDASLGKKDDGTIDPAPTSYPFQAPVAILEGGAELFPQGSEIKNGDYVDIDLDWTPSLHLNDAMLNIGLKVRESIRRGEPFFAAADQSNEEPVSDAASTTKKVGTFFSSLKQQGLSMAAAAAEVAAPTEKKEHPHPKAKKEPQRRKRSDGTVQIGDEIDLSESPWNVCAGMYSCKAIRRPDFVTAEMERAEEEAKKEQQVSSFFDDDDEDEVPSGPGNYMRLHAGSIGKVAGAGFSGAGSLLSSFKNSAKSVLEESFLMINSEHIIEMKTNKFSVGAGKVTFAIPVSFLAKLKFRRGESISLFFKQAPDDPLIYMCPESADCVQQIQSVLKRHGVKGKHTNAAMQRCIQMALRIVSDIQKKEKALEKNATVECVNEIMDLYRQAAEKFEQAGDARHEEVMAHMRKFLAKPLTSSILDGSYAETKSQSAPPVSSTPPKPVPQGEVLEATNCLLEEDDDDEEKKAEAKSSFQRTMKQTDDIIQEAKQDMEQLGGDNDLEDLLNSPDQSGNAEEGPDAIAELDAMLSAADKELADLMAE